MWIPHTNSPECGTLVRHAFSPPGSPALKPFPLLLCTVLLGLSGCVARAPAPRAVESASAPQTNSTVDQAYVQAAISGHLFQMQSAELALHRSRNPGVRALAQTIHYEHSQLLTQTSTALQAAGLQPSSPLLQPQHFGLFNQLQSVPSPQFDATFQNMQVMAHMQAVELHQRYSTTGSSSALRHLAMQAMGAENAHLATSQALRIAAPPEYRPRPRPGERG